MPDNVNAELLKFLGSLNGKLEKGLIDEAAAAVIANAVTKNLEEAEAKRKKEAAENNENNPNLDMKTIEEMVEKRVNERMADLKRQGAGNAVIPSVGLETLHPLKEAAVAATSNGDLVEFQKRHDRYYALKMLLSIVRKDINIPEVLAKSRVRRDYEDVAKAVYTTGVGQGDEWVYPGFSNQVLQRVDMQNKLWGLFDSLTIPQGVEDWTIPILGARGQVYLQGQAVNDSAAKYLTSTPGTDKLTLTVVTLAARYLFSQEMTEDSAIAILDWLMNDMVDVFTRARDDGILNGDTAATHQDADVELSIDHRKGWDGLRKIARDLGGDNHVDLGGTPTETQLMELRKGLGKLGEMPSDLVYITNLRGLIRMLSFSNFTSVEKYGPQATALTGELGRFYGVPVILSAFNREDLDATGVRAAGAGTKTEYILTYRKGFVTTNKRALRIEQAPDILAGQNNVVGTERIGFKRIRTAGDEKPVVVGYNVDI